MSMSLDSSVCLWPSSHGSMSLLNTGVLSFYLSFQRDRWDLILGVIARPGGHTSLENHIFMSWKRKNIYIILLFRYDWNKDIFGPFSSAQSLYELHSYKAISDCFSRNCHLEELAETWIVFATANWQFSLFYCCNHLSSFAFTNAL